MPDEALRVLLCRVFMALALLSTFPNTAMSQARPCDTNLKPVAGGVGYAWRAEGHRCEGLYQSTVSSIRLQLVSVLRGRLAFNLEEHRSLKVVAPRVPWLEDRQIRVRAVALPLKTYYRMDAMMPREGVLQWPLDEIIGRISLPAGKIGVYGWTEDDRGRLFVPLSVSTSDDTTTGAIGAPISIVVRSAVDLERLVWRTASENGQVIDQQEYPEAPVRAGRPITLTLAAGETAVLLVDVAGMPKQSDNWTKLRLRVLRSDR